MLGLVNLNALWQSNKKKVNCLVVFISELLRVPAKEGMGAVDTEPENLATRLTKGLLTYSIMLNH